MNIPRITWKIRRDPTGGDKITQPLMAKRAAEVIAPTIADAGIRKSRKISHPGIPIRKRERISTIQLIIIPKLND
jgi:hypothetical protein